MTDGRQADVYRQDGFFLGVSLIDNVEPDHDSYKNEIFGPVLEVMRVKTCALARPGHVQGLGFPRTR